MIIYQFFFQLFYGFKASLDTFHHPRRFNLQAMRTVHNAKAFCTIAKVVIVPNESGKPSLLGLCHINLAIVSHVFTHQVCRRRLVVVCHPPLSYHDTKTLKSPSLLNFGEGINDCLLILWSGSAMRTIAFSPILQFSKTAIIPRLIVMKLHTHITITVLFQISRNDEVSIVESKFRVTYIGLHHKMALGIIASCSAHNIYKCLIIGILHFKILCCRLSPVVSLMYFVRSSKSQTIIIVLKFRSDIHPEQSKLLAVLLFIFISRTTLKPFLMVSIDDDLHVTLQAVINYFFDAIHPSPTDGHSLCICDVTLPTDRNTNSIKTCCLHSIYQFLAYHRIAPRRLRIVCSSRIAYKQRFSIHSRSRTFK